MFKYRLENTVFTDKHLIYYNNYKLEIRFFIVKYWTLNVRYLSHDNCSILHLPTIDIVINKC